MLPRILFVYQSPSPFVLQDRDLLAKHTSVLDFRWLDHPRPARALARTMVRQRSDYDLVLAWFGDTHASVAFRVARWLRKPRILIVGGYDVSEVPEYGFLSTARNRRLARGHFARASRILAVSEALREELVRLFPGTAPKAAVLTAGVDADRFRPSGARDFSVLAVAPVDRWPRALIKGWDRVVQVAQRLPDVPFLLVGASREVIDRLQAPENVSVRGTAPQADLLSLYQRSAVFLHPSRSEGLPNALLEAMACGCVPVATRIGGIPEAVGDAGFLVSPDPDDLAQAVRRALSTPEVGARARARVQQSFSLAARERGLLAVISEFA